MLEEAWASEYTYIAIIVDTDAVSKLQVGQVFPTQMVLLSFKS